MAEQYKIIHPIKYYRDYLNVNIRPDGREFNKLRPIAINVGSITTADGSAIVKIGNTNVVCGIRAELAKPKASQPDQGFLVPNIELTSLCSAKYRVNSLSNGDAELYSLALNDILLNADCIDLKTLSIAKEKLVWCLYCDVVCLDHDGCVIDAAVIAVIAALRSLTLPKVIFEVETEKVTIDTSNRCRIKIDSSPVSTTMMVFDDNVIITDPTAEEESLSNCTLTIAVCHGAVCYILKPGGISFSREQMDSCIKQALDREKFVLELLDQILKN